MLMKPVDEAELRGYFEAKLERHLREGVCFSSAEWIEKLILPNGRRCKE